MPVQGQSNSSEDKINPKTIPLVLAEYNALKNEALKRIEIDHQLISISLITLTIILIAGFLTQSASIIFIYPILSLLLATIWTLNETGSREISIYIKDRIESRVGVTNIGWQHFKSSLPIGGYREMSLLGYRAVFIVSESLAILVGISVAKFNISENILLIVDSLSLILSVLILGNAPFKILRVKRSRTV